MTVSSQAPDWKSRVDLLGAAALFSTGGAFIKACSFAPPASDASSQIAAGLHVAGLRSLIAALFLLLVWPATRRGFSVRSLLFGVLYAGTMIAFVTANKLTTSANTIFLQSTAPLFVLLLSPFVLGEKVRRADLFFMAALGSGLALCFLDAVAAPGGPVAVQATAPRPMLGNMLALASGLFWASVIVGLRWFGRRAANDGGGHGANGGHRGNGKNGGDDGAAASVVVGNLTCFVAAAVLSSVLTGKPLPAPAQLNFANVGALLFLGIFQVGVAYFILTRGMRRVTAVEAALLLLVEPVFNPLWAFLVHGERPGRYTLLGGGVILAATGCHALASARAARATRAAGVVVQERRA